jgi:hypothetical protein
MKSIISLSAVCMAVAFICTPFFASATAGAAPVDGGLSLLVAAGVSYGAKKIVSRKKLAEK